MVRILVEYDRTEEAKEVAHNIRSEIDGPLRLRQSYLNVYVDAVSPNGCREIVGGRAARRRRKRQES